MGAVLGLCSAAQVKIYFASLFKMKIFSIAFICFLSLKLACCCTSTAASCLCSACPSCRNSTSARIMYALVLLLGAAVGAIMLSDGLIDLLRKVPFCENASTTASIFVPSTTTIDCTNAVGYLAVYRVCFALLIFFLAMAAMMIGVRSSRDNRAAIQNGFWAIKFIVVIAIAVGAFFIKDGSFGTWMMWAGMIGGSIFILIQLVLIIDFAHNWADIWVGNYEETQSKGWFTALMAATFAMYVLSLVGIIGLFYYYTQSNDCSLNKFFISFNMILCIAVSVLSITPKVQEYQPRSGLLQSAVVTLYFIYLTWSAVANNPDGNCNPGLLGIISDDKNKVSFDKTSIIGLVVWMFCILYSSLRSANAVSSLAHPDPERQGK